MSLVSKSTRLRIYQITGDDIKLIYDEIEYKMHILSVRKELHQDHIRDFPIHKVMQIVENFSSQSGYNFVVTNGFQNGNIGPLLSCKNLTVLYYNQFPETEFKLNSSFYEY